VSIVSTILLENKIQKRTSGIRNKSILDRIDYEEGSYKRWSFLTRRQGANKKERRRQMNHHAHKIGFVINPIAGMGGRVGLKGTDGDEVLQKARALGAESLASVRAIETLKVLHEVEEAIQIITYPSEMGANVVKKCKLHPKVIGTINPGKTSAIDTKKAIETMMGMNVKIILFVGGDGTARDVLDVTGKTIPILGVPAGVKMHSSVFAINPRAAGRIVIKFLLEGLPLREVAIMDVDEVAFSMGQISAKLYGYIEEEVQNQAAIAIFIHEMMQPNVIYILGPGTTTRTITDLLGEKKTLLGVDLLVNNKIIAKDVNEKQILETIKGKSAWIVVTPIGGQGFIFGRGNQQISPEVIRRVGVKKLTVIVTKHKLRGVKNLRVDTGDPSLDDKLRGYRSVIVDYREEHVVKVK
jgi:predicted polyphosphate/ATP-dependent NAD kinase